MADLRQKTFDVALRFGSGAYPGLHAEHLMDDPIFPVASPRYLIEVCPITRASDMLSTTRILDVTAENDESGTNWRTWFQHHELPMEDIDRGMRFNGALIALKPPPAGSAWRSRARPW